MRQKSQQQCSNEGSRERVMREDRGDEEGKGMAATRPVATIGAEDALSPLSRKILRSGIVSEEKAVTDERLGFAAAGAQLLLQGKRTRWR